MTFFSFLILLSATLVVVLAHPVHCLLALILSFLNFSFLLVFLNLEFLALAYVVVYVGAICVLFLFLILLLNLRSLERATSRSLSYLPLTPLPFLIFLWDVQPWSFRQQWNFPLSLLDLQRDLFLFAQSFFIHHFFFFLLSFLLLLLGILAVISLSLHQEKVMPNQP